jgi:hypothetical protein
MVREDAHHQRPPFHLFHQPLEPQSGQTIEHTIGDVIIGFEELDDAISFAISGILNRSDEIGRIVTSQLSFRCKRPET